MAWCHQAPSHYLSQCWPSSMSPYSITNAQWVNCSSSANTWQTINTLRPRQNGRHLADDILKCVFFNENAWIWLKISLKFVPMVRINNIPALVQLMAWRRSGDKPLSEPMMVSLLTHICVTRPQWVNTLRPRQNCCLFPDIFKSNAFPWIKMHEFLIRFH